MYFAEIRTTTALAAPEDVYRRNTDNYNLVNLGRVFRRNTNNKQNNYLSIFKQKRGI